MYQYDFKCMRKVRYATEGQAKNALSHVKDDIPKPLHVYYCEVCMGYHIGEDKILQDQYKNDIIVDDKTFKFKTNRDDPESARDCIDFLTSKGFETHVITTTCHTGAKGRPRRFKRYRIYVRKDD